MELPCDVSFKVVCTVWGHAVLMLSQDLKKGARFIVRRLPTRGKKDVSCQQQICVEQLSITTPIISASTFKIDQYIRIESLHSPSHRHNKATSSWWCAEYRQNPWHKVRTSNFRFTKLMILYKIYFLQNLIPGSHQRIQLWDHFICWTPEMKPWPHQDRSI